MFDAIIDIFVQIWDAFIPWVIVDPYEQAIILTWGKCTRLISNDDGMFGTGFHWKWPLIQQFMEQSIVVTTMDLSSQSLTTKDGKSIVVSSIVKYRVDDITKFLLGISDQFSAIADITAAKTKQVITQSDWEHIDSSTDLKIAELVRDEVKKYGIRIEPKGIVLVDLQVCRSIRLLQDVAPIISVGD